MKKINLLVVGCAASLVGMTGMAASTQSQPSAVKLQHMEKQLIALQDQVAQLEKEHSKAPVKKTSQRIQRKSVAAKDSGQTQPVSSSFKNYLKSQGSVVVAPFTSKPTYYSGGQLVIAAPSVSEDEKLLYRRLLNENQYLRAGLETPEKPRLVLSGKVEGLASYSKPYSGRYNSDIDLYGAELDTLAEITPWVNGFLALAYTNNPSTFSSTMTGSNRRIDNSRIYVDKGFLTIGNFAESGFYGSIGQFYVPFGRYDSVMIDSPLTSVIGEVKARAISFNYISSDPRTHLVTPYAHIYVFKGDTKYGNHNNIVKNGGVDFGSWFGTEQVNGNLGAGYIVNIADANSAQDNGRGAGFMGFEQTAAGPSSENIVHGVGGLDAHGNFAYGPWSLIAEYLTAIQKYALVDMSYNGHGARPSALNTEAIYTFTVFNMPSSFGVGYGLSQQALAYNIPHQRYIAAWSLTFLENTIFTLEARHDINYGKGDTATGNAGPGAVPVSAVTAGQLGKVNNAILARVGVYF